MNNLYTTISSLNDNSYLVRDANNEVIARPKDDGHSFCLVWPFVLARIAFDTLAQNEQVSFEVKVKAFTVLKKRLSSLDKKIGCFARLILSLFYRKENSFANLQQRVITKLSEANSRLERELVSANLTARWNRLDSDINRLSDEIKNVNPYLEGVEACRGLISIDTKTTLEELLRLEKKFPEVLELKKKLESLGETLPENVVTLLRTPAKNESYHDVNRSEVCKLLRDLVITKTSEEVKLLLQWLDTHPFKKQYQNITISAKNGLKMFNNEIANYGSILQKNAASIDETLSENYSQLKLIKLRETSLSSDVKEADRVVFQAEKLGLDITPYVNVRILALGEELSVEDILDAARPLREVVSYLLKDNPDLITQCDQVKKNLSGRVTDLPWFSGAHPYRNIDGECFMGAYSEENLAKGKEALAELDRAIKWGQKEENSELRQDIDKLLKGIFVVLFAKEKGFSIKWNTLESHMFDSPEWMGKERTAKYEAFKKEIEDFEADFTWEPPQGEAKHDSSEYQRRLSEYKKILKDAEPQEGGLAAFNQRVVEYNAAIHSLEWLIGVNEDTNLKDAYRALLLATHPDKGGCREAFVAAKTVYGELLA